MKLLLLSKAPAQLQTSCVSSCSCWTSPSTPQRLQLARATASHRGSRQGQRRGVQAAAQQVAWQLRGSAQAVLLQQQPLSEGVPSPVQQLGHPSPSSGSSSSSGRRQAWARRGNAASRHGQQMHLLQLL
jgi:hypothetical protein